MEAPFRCDYGTHIEAGNSKFLCNFNCVILDVAKVTIGENIMLPQCGGLYGWPSGSSIRETVDMKYGIGVMIGDNVWVGGNSLSIRASISAITL